MNTARAESEPVQQRILVIDDEPGIGLSCRRILEPEGHEVASFVDSQAGLQAALSGEFDLVIVDLMMPGLSGMEILKSIKGAGVSAEVVIITGYSTVESAVEAMKEGAADYLSKPFTPNELKMVLGKVFARSALIRENVALRQELEVHQGFEGILGDSRTMERVFALIRRVARTDGTVLITGESGTGKEMVVRALHRLSRRRDQPLLGCDCSALAPTLLESELFGHVKGSFSGAIATKQGLFEAAHKGTLFLDEVANLSLETQGKLLRVLETRRATPRNARSISVWWRRRTATCSRWCVRARSARICITGSMLCRSTCPPSGSAKETSPCWPTLFSRGSARRTRST